MAIAQTQEVAEGFFGGARQPVTENEVERAIAGLTDIAPSVRRLSSDDRAVILERVARALADDAEQLATALTAESGFLTHRDMVLEVQRAVEVFTHAAAVARVGLDEVLNVDAVARARDAIGIVRHEPIGPVLGITAFNGPLLIAAHKVAPAIVAGAPIVLKPSPRVPGGAIALAEVVVGCGWPAAALAVLPVDDETTMRLIRDPRLPVVSFTGGSFGWVIKDAVPRKHVHLELGGVGAVIVAADADLETAAAECAAGGFVRSGQACIAVQRIYVERSVCERFTTLLAGHVRELVTGDPNDPLTGVGPLVDEPAAIRVEEMINDALGKGARAVCGGTRNGRIVEPTVLADVSSEMSITQREAFGPVVAVVPVDNLAEAVAATNDVPGAIHAGVYTSDLDVALTVSDEVHAGAVIVNGPSSWRVDHMPYGGVGDSGFGREGIRAMVGEYTEPKVLIIRHRVSSLS
jgi:acyl-CoA reductase-like NAD-dependent aldehyde dehydrogenase